jgi:tubulin--tyrosine ligase
LTNTARAAEDVNFKEELFVKTLDDLPAIFMHERPDLAPSREKANDVIAKIKDDVYSITNELFKAFENEYTVFAPMNNCFEIYGLDFMVDEDLNTSLLEINPGPDFQQTGIFLNAVTYLYLYLSR